MFNKRPGKQAFAVLLLLAAIVHPAVAAYADYTGPSDTRLYTSVADVLQNPVDDAPVSLEGVLVRRIDSETYLFSDGTGEIEVEIEAEHMPRESFDQTRRLRLIGEVDTRLLRAPEIEVDRVVLLPVAGG
ncbi:MAG: NirD/YgiW/YdeI family stress tolerance protein [Gammaproteobacteria bacterium]|nr:NirD/YgiW/YdeI family stress tolerance protein [Gammaproteobacteria bacterium]